MDTKDKLKDLLGYYSRNAGKSGDFASLISYIAHSIDRMRVDWHRGLASEQVSGLKKDLGGAALEDPSLKAPNMLLVSWHGVSAQGDALEAHRFEFDVGRRGEVVYHRPVAHLRLDHTAIKGMFHRDFKGPGFIESKAALIDGLSRAERLVLGAEAWATAPRLGGAFRGSGELFTFNGLPEVRARLRRFDPDLSLKPLERDRHEESVAVAAHPSVQGALGMALSPMRSKPGEERD